MARGVDFLIFIDTSDGSGDPTFKKVAGQRGGTYTPESDTLDITSKDNAGWQDVDYGQGSWKLEGDGVLVEDDEAFLKLEDAFYNKDFVYCQWKTAAGRLYSGYGVITSFPQDAPYDDLATYKLEITGKGKPEVPTNSFILATGLTLSDTESSVEVGADVTLTATVAPDNATNKKVNWSSSDPTIATVDQSGKVHGVKAGTAVIIAELDDDPTKQAVNIVTVTEAAG